MSIDRAFISELLEATDLVGLISESLALKRQGSEFAACCPFHHEETPSFTVSSKKQFFYCFGCKAHGNAIDFLIKFFGISFRESLEQLATRAGMSLPETPFTASTFDKEAKTRQSKHEALQKAMARLINFYEQQWSTALGKKAKEYLVKARGFQPRTLRRFHVGVSGWSGSLRQYFSSEEINLLIEIGAFRGSPQAPSETFRHRVTFPIQNEKQWWVGFGGRTTQKDHQPKYLNSSESPWFQKRKLLYGFAETKEELRSPSPNPIMAPQDILLVEGYLDVFACHQVGLKQVVATLGTAISDTQLTVLFRNFDRLFICYDADEAGRRATGKLIDKALPHLKPGKSIFFVDLPLGQDPADFLKDGTSSQLVEAVQNALPLSCKLFDPAHAKGLQYAEGRAHFLRELGARIDKIPDSFFQSELRRIESGYRQNFMAPNSESASFPEKGAELQQANPEEGVRPQSSSFSRKRPVRIIFALLIQNPELIQRLKLSEVVMRWLPKVLKKFVSDILGQDVELWTKSSLAQRLLIWKETPVENILKEISFWDHLIDPAHWLEELHQSFQTLAEQACHQRLKKFLGLSKQRRLKQEEMAIYCQALKELQMLREGKNRM